MGCNAHFTNFYQLAPYPQYCIFRYSVAHHGDKVKRKAPPVRSSSDQQLENVELLRTEEDMSGDGQAGMSGDGQAGMSGDGQAEMSGDGQAEMSGDGQAEMSGDIMDVEYDLSGVTCMFVIFCLLCLHNCNNLG